ncbi:MAG: exosortase/archaeosortase family protein [Opitutaceae bacterium]|nr:exosortase/archaeosortase family protein [Opitutaceae bacterium]
MSAAPATPPLSATSWIVVCLAGLLTAAFCVHLWPEWLHNPDLSHGLFAPVLFVLLLHDSRRHAPWRHPAENTRLRLLRTGALVLGLVFVSIAGLYAAAIDWTHSLVSLSLALALSALLAAALLWFSSDRVRALPLNWTTLVAVALWPLCAPIPPGTYTRLTLQLQFWVTDIVLNSLHLLGIAASTSGNIILLARTSVGVEEACSGVRSLLSCVVAAIFFSATLVRRPWARVLLIALAPPLAFGMNIIRSLGLTLLANSGVDISGTWHDVTGFAILGLTALILGALALWLEEPARPATPTAPLPNAAPPAARPWGLLTAYMFATVMLGFFVLNTHGPVRNSSLVPDLQKILPTAPAGWDLVRTDDLYQFSPILKTEHLVQRTYVRRRASPQNDSPLQITVYLAYWSPGAVPVSAVAAHTPDACWPGGGWVPQPVQPADAPFLVGNRPVSAPEYRTFTNSGVKENVWFWHLYDGRSIAQNDPRSALALLKLSWTYGFRTAGEQVFVRISSNRPWTELRDEPLVNEVLTHLQPFGL